NRLAGEVHECLRLDQQHLLAAYPAFRDKGAEFPGPRRKGMAAVYFIRRHEPDIVPLSRILRPGISKPCDKQHVHSSLGCWNAALKRLLGFRLALGGFLTLSFLGLEASRSGDRGDREVAVGDGRLHALRQRYRRDVDRVAKLGTLQVDNDVVRDRIGWAQELDFVANDVQNATALDAGRKLFVHEVNRDVDGHDRVLADAQEVDMQRHVLHAVELVFLRQRADGLAIHFDVENGRGEAATVDAVVDFLGGNRDGKR